jgi:hypothetical protein
MMQELTLEATKDINTDNIKIIAVTWNMLGGEPNAAILE